MWGTRKQYLTPLHLEREIRDFHVLSIQKRAPDSSQGNASPSSSPLPSRAFQCSYRAPHLVLAPTSRCRRAAVSSRNKVPALSSSDFGEQSGRGGGKRLQAVVVVKQKAEETRDRLNRSMKGTPFFPGPQIPVTAEAPETQVLILIRKFTRLKSPKSLSHPVILFSCCVRQLLPSSLRRVSCTSLVCVKRG